MYERDRHVDGQLRLRLANRCDWRVPVRLVAPQRISEAVRDCRRGRGALVEPTPGRLVPFHANLQPAMPILSSDVGAKPVLQCGQRRIGAASVATALPRAQPSE